jgi:hypothetical protein
MKKQTEYQRAKSFLKEMADIIKEEHPQDKPMQRMVINDTCDEICKDLRLPDYHRELLANYSCKLHPKD